MMDVNGIITILALTLTGISLIYSCRDHAVKTLELELSHLRCLYNEEKELKEKTEKALKEAEAHNKALRDILGPMLPDLSQNTKNETKNIR